MRKRLKPSMRHKLPQNESDLGYICGILATDGYVPADSFKKRIQLSLHKQDKDTLQWIFNTLTGEELELYSDPKGGNNLRFYKALPQMYDYCISMGIVSPKSHDLNPDILDKSDEFKWHFMRGVIDGDGSIHIANNPGDSSIRISSCSMWFLRSLQTIFGGNIVTLKNCRSLDFTGSRAIKLASKLPINEYYFKRKTIDIIRIKESTLIKNRPMTKNIPIGSIWGEEVIDSYTTYDLIKSLVALEIDSKIMIALDFEGVRMRELDSFVVQDGNLILWPK